MSQLNFARVPFRNERLPAVFYGLAAAALVAVTMVHGLFLTRYLLREQEELDVKVASLQDEIASLDSRIGRTQAELQSQRNQVGTERIRFVARLYFLKNFSWTGFFNELEILTPPAVRITSIAPGQLSGRDDDIKEEIEVQLQVVARNLQDILEMIRRLEENRLFTWVLPLSEADRAETDEGGYAATLTLRYLRQDEDQHETSPEAAEKIAEEGNSEGETEVIPSEGEPPSPGTVTGKKRP